MGIDDVSAKKVILDTDIGTDCDDALALALCLKSPKIDLVGVTCVYGDVCTRAKIAHKLISLSGCGDIPVYEGCSMPLMTDRKVFWAGHEGKGFVETYDAYQQKNGNAVDFIIETVMSNRGEITLIPIGPLTNIAAALIKEPRLAMYVKEVVIMGGAAKPGSCIQLPDGNRMYVYHAEHNYHCDPEAAKVVFNADMPTTMVGLDVTLQVHLERKHMEKIAAVETPFVDGLLGQVDIFTKFTGKDWTFLHDPLAVGVCIDESFVRTNNASVKIVTYPEFIAGQVIADFNAGGSVKICTDVDSERFVEFFVRHMISEKY